MASELGKHSAIFRRVYPNLKELMRYAREVIKDSAHENKSEKTWEFSNGRSIEFGAVQFETDKTDWQGRPHDHKLFDEITEFEESIYVFICAWNRTTDPGQRVRVVCTGNPPIDEKGNWVIKRWAPWLDDKHPNPAKPGELRWYATINGEERECKNGEPICNGDETIYPISRTFIPAKLDDNPFLAGDNRYRSILQSLPEPLRSQMLYGDFRASSSPDPWQIIPTEWVLDAQRRWLETEKPKHLTAVGIDPARGGLDNMSIAKRYDSYFDDLAFRPGAAVPTGPIGAEFVRQELNGEEPEIMNIDIGGIGSSVYDSLHDQYPGITAINAASASEYRDKSGKLKMRNMRAEYYWRMRDSLDPNGGDNISLPPGNEVVADLCSAKYKVTVSGVLVEEKAEIKKRIGRSPDKGESLLLANLITNSGSSWDDVRDLGKVDEFESRWK